MKNSILIFSVALMTVACQKPKDWECTCECTPVGGSSFTKKTTIEGAKQSQANSQCGDFGKAQVNGNGTWKCTIQSQ